MNDLRLLWVKITHRITYLIKYTQHLFKIECLAAWRCQTSSQMINERIFQKWIADLLKYKIISFIKFKPLHSSVNIKNSLVREFSTSSPAADIKCIMFGWFATCFFNISIKYYNKFTANNFVSIPNIQFLVWLLYLRLRLLRIFSLWIEKWILKAFIINKHFFKYF